MHSMTIKCPKCGYLMGYSEIEKAYVCLHCGYEKGKNVERHGEYCYKIEDVVFIDPKTLKCSKEEMRPCGEKNSYLCVVRMLSKGAEDNDRVLAGTD